MHSVNHSVVESLSSWFEAKQDLWLATIISTWGASPRPSGSLFAFNAVTGETAGSLSGGCVEDDLLRELRSASPIHEPVRKLYGSTHEERSRLQLPCGGTLQLLLEYFPGTDAASSHFASILKALDTRERICREVNLSPYTMTCSITKDAPGISEDTSGFRHVLGPGDRLLIVGLSEVAKYLIPIAESLDFSVTVCDPREEYVERNRVSRDAITSLQCLPDDLIRNDFNDEHCAIVALAHDPRVDDLAMLAALESRAFYIGAMGSQKSSLARLERLQELGISPEQCARIEGPIGFPLGSKTPPEIAVAIGASLIKSKSLRQKQLS